MELWLSLPELPACKTPCSVAPLGRFNGIAAARIVLAPSYFSDERRIERHNEGCANTGDWRAVLDIGIADATRVIASTVLARRINVYLLLLRNVSSDMRRSPAWPAGNS